jgi:hypothetical protein
VLLALRGGSNLICKEGFQVFHVVVREGALIIAHSLLQSATPPFQHFHYLRWLNLHVRRSVILHYIFL